MIKLRIRRKAIKVTNPCYFMNVNSFKNTDKYASAKVWRIVYTAACVYGCYSDKLEIETINREFLALVHLSYEIESSNKKKKKGEQGIDSSDARIRG